MRLPKRRGAGERIAECIGTPSKRDDICCVEHVSQALAFIKKTSGAEYFYDVPWFVIIGPPGAPATTIIRRSQLRLLLAQWRFGHSEPTENVGGGSIYGVGGTRNCDWWLTEEAILLDAVGRYGMHRSDFLSADRNESWFAFLQRLKSIRSNPPIDGAIVVFPVNNFVWGTRSDITAQANEIRRQLLELQDGLEIALPVHVLFCKCDLVAGFMEYFSNLTEAERQCAWGAALTSDERGSALAETVSIGFDHLIEELRRNLTNRFSEEENLNWILRSSFPLQM